MQFGDKCQECMKETPMIIPKLNNLIISFYIN